MAPDWRCTRRGHPLNPVQSRCGGLEGAGTAAFCGLGSPEDRPSRHRERKWWQGRMAPRLECCCSGDILRTRSWSGAVGQGAQGLPRHATRVWLYGLESGDRAWSRHPANLLQDDGLTCGPGARPAWPGSH
ncbi:hypothetical protein NDU88_001508 [Pleurodeles waltl]|uniref:Uncharacterized protein n=1 Tax=Pleurodeles waltl TaxID=8319 RepID=A0AAV7KPS0_PLEWA|nr:hypothetical protein NDU88_001508 [Pleurodeles waltl]